MSKVAIISSPLQALVFFLILPGIFDSKKSRFIVFLEGDYKIPPYEGVTCISLDDTRSAANDTLSDNLKTILGFIPNTCELWISDLLWPMNNATYTLLLKLSKLNKVNFFDEGMVLYAMEKLSMFRYVRESFKFIFLRFQTGLDYSIPHRHHFFDNKKNGDVYALHPELLANKTQAKKLSPNISAVINFDSFVDGDSSLPEAHCEQEFDQSALLLSQPYYRITSIADFSNIIKQLTSFLILSGCKKLYVKLHPSEDYELYEILYKNLGYQIVFSGSRSPIEAKFNLLPENMTLISFNSSALVNARIFGFRGKVISYGLDKIKKMYNFQKSLFVRQKEIFHSAGVEIV